jgi:hypothetical protein
MEARNTMATKTQTPEEVTYRTAKRATGSAADACLAVMRTHGLTQAQAADLSWRIETGKPMPKFTEAGTDEPNAAAMRWTRGADRQHDKE